MRTKLENTSHEWTFVGGTITPVTEQAAVVCFDMIAPAGRMLWPNQGLSANLQGRTLLFLIPSPARLVSGSQTGVRVDKEKYSGDD